jgi:bacillolysin
MTITAFHKKITTLIALVCIPLLYLSIAQAAPAANGKAYGFQAITGQTARGFTLPIDVTEVGHRILGPNLSSRRYTQIINNAEVLGGQLTLYSDAQGNVLSIIGAHYPNLLTTNDIKLNAANAQTNVVQKIGGSGKWLNQLMIDPKSGRYFYRVESRRTDSRWFYWIDAENGNVLNAYDGLTHSDGLGVLGDIKDLTGLTTPVGNSFQLVSANGRITTYDSRNRNRLPGVLATDDDDSWDLSGSNSPGQPALVDAQYYANVTDNYYLLTHGFDWLNFYSQGMVSSAHLKRNYNNAYWNGEQMAYGDGDGSTYIEFSGDLDVVGHELSHGVTEATSNLIYQNESGALNEAFSDIMGSNIEYYYGTGNWTIGEDITVGTNGLRNMADPGEDGDPSHYDERYTGTADNGGVHINSGIANHWYYLLVNGGVNSDPNFASTTGVTGIGLAAAEQIAFLGFTALNATATFCDARTSTIAVAQAHANNVGTAWDEVGVTDATCSGSGGGGGGDELTIENVSSQTLNGVKFQITWDTNLPSNSVVIFACCGTYTDTALVTSHAMNFNGKKNVAYEYYVRSTTENGATTMAGPYTHQN